MRHVLILVCSILALNLVACKPKTKSKDKGHGKHAHKAPHGGVMVELEDHVANAEITFDAKSGTLTLYCLGGHGHKSLVPEQSQIVVLVKSDKAIHTLTLEGVTNSLTGETKGKSSQFQVIEPKLRALTKFQGTIKSLKIKGTEYTDVAFSFPNK